MKQIHKWKVQTMLTTGFASELKVGRIFLLPDCLGLGEDARWRWKWIPISMLLGIKGGTSTGLYPYVRLKSLTPAFGKLALQPIMEISAIPVIGICKKFSVGPNMFAIRASLKAGTEGVPWTLQLTWKSSERDMLQTKVASYMTVLEYLQRCALSRTCKAVFRAAVKMPFLHSHRPVCGDTSSGSVHITQYLGLRASRDKPLPTIAYLKASERFGQSKTITICPGHFIDPGNESGAPGEREFNLEIVNVLEKDLSANGWRVLRPDRDAPNLSWEEYLNWVSKQTCSGHPVVEIHGQGSSAMDSKGSVVGVIGDPYIMLNRELARNIGFLNIDWKELGVPRRGGVIVESFNADEILQMAPSQRVQAARYIGGQLMDSIQRISSKTDAKKIGD
ncbi:hypothetical protein KP509_03G087000 [Ceratopteris richardii]|uniref:Uncharacterized protein n=1 Tax=Ceratopteris richardii TaxID=49495 RepID=A0A8T2V9N6_CERRI|nr:hypothetical protein KP509_03G087000 [Ceratopteris richardii]